MWSYPCNSPRRPIELWDVEAPTFSRQSAQRWRWGYQPYASAAFCFQEDSWYSFLLIAESTPGPSCGWKDYVNWKIRWPHRESNPRLSGLSYSTYGIDYEWFSKDVDMKGRSLFRYNVQILGKAQEQLRSEYSVSNIRQEGYSLSKPSRRDSFESEIGRCMWHVATMICFTVLPVPPLECLR
jgi:hypothetical protein